MSALRLTVSGWLAVALAALLLLVPAPGTGRAEAATDTQPTAAHPYGDPTWFPLRAATKIGCAKSGCQTSEDHDYWAIDLLGAQGDPVYAAGAGVAHVGGNDGSCSSTGDVNGGRWVWVDHGGGVVTRYYHLDRITVADGQLVTPTTRIGEMGHSGDVPPCQISYLHFEVRHGGLYGERVPFGDLRGCVGSRAVTFPEVMGFSDWNAPGLHPAKKLVTPALGNDCVSPDWRSTPAAPQPTTTRTSGAITVGLAATPGVTGWMANIEIWRPSLNAWKTLDLAMLPAGTTSVTFTDEVEDHRQYRVQAALRNGQGWSAWSSMKEVVAAPEAPDTRYLQWKRPTNKTKSYLHYGWTRPDALGSAVTGYRVARRCGSSATKLSGWRNFSFGSSTYWNDLRKLKKEKVCEVRIQATNAAGAGAWSATQTVTR